MWDARRASRVLRSRGSLSERRLAILLCIGIAPRWCGLSSRRLTIFIFIRIVLLVGLREVLTMKEEFVEE
jgi:hypothetical protein